jgi:deoxyribodipyrimidine photo-lyase
VAVARAGPAGARDQEVLSGPALVWFRQDLRLADNPALRSAAARGAPVIPVYVWSPEEEGGWEPGGASRWWLHRSLHALDAELRRHRSRLIVRRGPALKVLRQLIAETGAGAVRWNRRYEPHAVERDRAVKRELAEDGVEVESANAALLFEPWTVATGGGDPYRVFTPFWKACLAAGPPPQPEPVPSLRPPSSWPESLAIDDLGLDPAIDWAGGLEDTWRPGERSAGERLDAFLEDDVASYAHDRDRPDRPGTARLSPHLHHGEIGPRQIWHEIHGRGLDPRRFLAEVGWREFAHHLLYHFPHTPERPLRHEFERFPWRTDRAALRAWQCGQTGYPLVDAGMHQLWTTGWMHNRVRMVVASFLVKHLLLPWQEGARWFWDTLVDADLANNTLGWQWTAGCGADAAPFFRIFNPALQAERYDPAGDYVRAWAPDPPAPIVDHRAARERALEAFAEIRPGSPQHR